MHKIKNRLAFIFPGQGSQFKGMGKDFFEDFPSSRKLFFEANEILGYDIQSICFEDTNQNLNKTIYTQPAIYLNSIVINKILNEKNISPTICAGHSLGEISAIVCAGCLSFEDGLKLIKTRATEMFSAIKSCTKNHNITIANYNSKKQIILSGKKNDINTISKEIKLNNLGKVIPLNVSGAFHSPLMRPASKALQTIINSLNFKDANIPVYQNFDSEPSTESESIKRKLLLQLENPVKWDETINKMKLHASQFIEVGPKNVLTNLNKTIDRSIVSISISSAVDLKNSLNET
jgi:[acyl-carrier-protein] S-malonyltransferase